MQRYGISFYRRPPGLLVHFNLEVVRDIQVVEELEVSVAVDSADDIAVHSFY